MGIVVVAVDGSTPANAALDEALELTAATGDGLLLVSVWRPLRGDFGIGFPPGAITPELLEGDRPRAEHVLADAFERVRAAGREAGSELAMGDPAAELCRIAEERGARLLALGSHGHGLLARALLGSVSTAVLHHAPCPVLVVRREEDEPDEADVEPAQ